MFTKGVFLISLVALIGIAACHEEPEQSGIVGPPQRDIAVDTRATALAARIRDAGGRAVIGIKEPNRTRGVNRFIGKLPRNKALEAEAALRSTFSGRGINILKGIDRRRTVHDRTTIKTTDFYVPFLSVEMQADSAVISQLLVNRYVDYVIPSGPQKVNMYTRRRAVLPTPAGTSSVQLGFDYHPWGIDTVRAPLAWTGTPPLTGLGYRIGMVDTGMDLNPELTPVWHPDFELHPQNVAGVFVSFAPDDPLDVASGSCIDYWQHGPCYYEAPYHGSGVLGLAVGYENDEVMIGVAPNAGWQVAKATYEDSFFGDLITWPEDYAEAVYWFSNFTMNGTLKVGVTAIGFNSNDTTVSSSWRPVHDAFRDAAAGDSVLWFAAAGDIFRFPGVVLPAAYAQVVAVGAVDQFLNQTINSPEGVELVAPGGQMCTAWNRLDYTSGLNCFEGGTSYAAAIAAGVAILAHERIDPALNLTASGMRGTLHNHARDLGSPGYDPVFGYGMVDAVCSAYLTQPPCLGTEPPRAPGDPPPGDPLNAEIIGPTSIRAQDTCGWISSVSGGVNPYSYKWFRKNAGSGPWTLVSNQSDYSGGMDGHSSFQLKLEVRDLLNDLATDQITVTDDGLLECLMTE